VPWLQTAKAGAANQPEATNSKAGATVDAAAAMSRFVLVLWVLFMMCPYLWLRAPGGPLSQVGATAQPKGDSF
jgi:hypothetical protein